MKAQTQILPPTNWQDFEELCKRIWENKWNNPDDIIRNGRLGQSQNGVDISAYVESKCGYCGVQCKGKDNFTNKQMTTVEIDEEINKAKNFKPALKSLVFATTAPKDATIEEYVRTRNIENIENGLFSIAIFSWEDIVSLIEQYKSVKDWYVYEKLQSFEPDIDIVVNGQISTESSPITLNPEYTKQSIFYEHKPKSIFDSYSVADVETAIQSSFRRGNSVKIKFAITNNGDFLENCIFSVKLDESCKHKFYNGNLYDKINSQLAVEDNYAYTTKEFTLHSGFTKNIELYVEFSEIPCEDECVLECCFTSKQNKKPYYSKTYIKSVPKIIDLPQKTILTNNYNNRYTVEMKPKEIDE